MITLGINAAFHGSSAALVMEGAVLAAAEEERTPIDVLVIGSFLLEKQA